MMLWQTMTRPTVICTIRRPGAPYETPGSPWLTVVGPQEPYTDAALLAQQDGAAPRTIRVNMDRADWDDLYHSGVGDMLHTCLTDDIFGLQVLRSECGYLAALRIVARRPIDRPRCGVATLAMTIARQHANFDISRSAGHGGAWPCEPPRVRRGLFAHQKQALQWMRALDESASRGELMVDCSADIAISDSLYVAIDRRNVTDDSASVLDGRPAPLLLPACGGLLADPCGGGKTATMVSLMASSPVRSDDGPLPSTGASLVVARRAMFHRWQEHFDWLWPDCRLQCVCTLRQLRALTLRDLGGADAVLLAAEMADSQPYMDHAMAEVQRLAEFTNHGTLGSLGWDRTLLQVAKARVRTASDGAAVFELLRWRRLVIDDAHRCGGRDEVVPLCAGRLSGDVTWLLSGTPAAPADYLQWLIPSAWGQRPAGAVAAVQRRLTWRWHPPSDVQPVSVITPPPSEREMASGGSLALNATNGVAHSQLPPALSADAIVAAARAHVERLGAQLLASAASHDATAAEIDDAGLRDEAQRLRAHAEDLDAQLQHLRKTIAEPLAGCPCCLGQRTACVFPLCGHGVCGDCFARMTSAAGPLFCPVCRRPVEEDAALWSLPNGTEAPRGTRTAALLQLLRSIAEERSGAERVVVVVRTVMVQRAVVQAISPFVQCERLRGPYTTRAATLRRFCGGDELSLLVLCVPSDDGVQLAGVTDVVLYEGCAEQCSARATASYVGRALGYGRSLGGSPCFAAVHVIGECSARTLRDWTVATHWHNQLHAL